MTFDPNFDLVCAIDLGGTNLRSANIDPDGVICSQDKHPTPKTDRPEEIVAAMAATVTSSRYEAARTNQTVKTISVVVPGSVETESGTIVNAPNIPCLQGFRLGKALQEKFQCDVLLENDANAAAVGELWKGAGRDCQTIVCLTLGTGVGSGIILEGKLWRGTDGTAGEIGHTSVDPFNGARCKCGNTGCLEVCASAIAIVRITRELLSKYSDSILNSSADALTSERIARAAGDGDELALEVFRRVGTYLGVALANIVNTLNPEAIIIGGGVSGAFHLFAPRAQKEMIARAFPVPAKRCRILKAECGNHAGLIGAARLALQRGSLSSL